MAVLTSAFGSGFSRVFSSVLFESVSMGIIISHLWYNRGMKGKFFRENRYLLKPFLIIFLIYLVGISAIILAGVHYADDVARTNYGYAGWSGFSRYLSTILSHGLHADNYLTNIAPLPQLLAVAILAVSSMIVITVVNGAEIFKEKWTRWILPVIAVVPLGLCPYMLECLSYQYDAVYMALSVFFVVMPFLFYRESRGKFVVFSVIGVLGACMTYQVSAGIYPMLAIFVIMKDWNGKKIENKEIIKNILLMVATFGLTLILFQKVLMRPQDIYVSNEVPGLAEFFPSLFSHLSHYFELLFNDFRILWLVLVGIMMLEFVVVFVKKSERNKILAAVLGMIGVGAMLLMSYLLYSALDKPLYTTRAMYAVGAFMAIIGVYAVSGDVFGKIAKKYVGKKTEMEMQMSVRISRFVLAIPVVMLAWCFFSFAFTYGNALKEQDTFKNMQIDMVISDLNEIVSDGKVRKVQAEGQIEFAPAVKHMPSGDYLILRRLLKPSYGTTPWMAYRLTEASGLNNLVYNPSASSAAEDLSVLKDTALYIIYGDDEDILVRFKGEEFNIWED